MNTKSIDKKMSPYDNAFSRLYFVNLITGSHFTTLHEANDTKAANIAKKLSGTELQYLIEKIEEKL